MKNEENNLKNTSGELKVEKLDDNDLIKVAGGFEITVPFKEFIKSNLMADKRTDKNSDKKS